MQGAAKWLTIVGLVLTLIGAGSATYGVWLSPDEAVERGASRWSGGTREQQLQLPAVQNLLQQSRFAVAGFVLIGLGTLLQIVGVVIRGHHEDEDTETSFRRKQIRAAWSLNRITFGAAVVALGGLVVLFFTLSDNRKTMIEDHRAWIAVRTLVFDDTPPPKNPGDLFQIAVPYENIGKEPALTVSRYQEPFWTTDFALRSSINKLSLPPNNTCSQVNSELNIGTSWPGTSSGYISHGSASQITADADFLGMTSLLGYHGCFIYETFQEAHRTGYCFLLIPVIGRPVAEWVWQICPGAGQNFAD
jgi:hypothetical protein